MKLFKYIQCFLQVCDSTLIGILGVAITREVHYRGHILRDYKYAIDFKINIW